MDDKRIEYVDCLRGVTMIMVVFSHVLNSCFSVKGNVAIWDVVGIVQMPLFFFVSGLFSQMFMSWKSFGKRLLYVLWPTIAIFILFAFTVGQYSCMSALGLVFHWIQEEYKGGYWFTFALLLMNIVHLLSSEISKVIKPLDNRWNVVFLIIFAISLILLKDWDYSANNGILNGWFSLRLVASYFPFYLLGIICKWRYSLFDKIMTSSWCRGAFIVAFFVLFYFLEGSFYVALMKKAMGLLVVFSIFHAYSSFFSRSTFCGRWLSYVGRKTLSIYLLHYFFLKGMSFPQIGALADVQSQWVLISLLALGWAVIIIVFCLLTNVLVSVSQPLHRLLLGK